MLIDLRMIWRNNPQNPIFRYKDFYYKIKEDENPPINRMEICKKCCFKGANCSNFLVNCSSTFYVVEEKLLSMLSLMEDKK